MSLTLKIKCLERDSNNYIVSEGNHVRDLYQNHTTAYANDSGVDLFCIEDQVIPANSYGNVLRLGVACEMLKLGPFMGCRANFNNCAYMLVARSSLSKTPLMLSNSVGIIDAGYRGELRAMVVNVSSRDYVVHRGDKLFQIVHPSLRPFSVEFVNELSSSERGERGFGSSGLTK